MKLTFQLVTSILTPLLVTAPMRAAMQSSEPPAVMQIRISVVDRDGNTVPAGSKSEKGFTVLVADSAGAPVGDSAVVFRLPDEGPGGAFEDSSHSAIVYTSASGLARVSGIAWNTTPGQVAIKVTATKGDARAGMLLTETLSAPSASAPAASSDKPASITAASPHENTSAAVQPGLPGPQEKPAFPHPAEVPQAIAPVPAVSVVNSNKANTGYHSSHKKWIILAAVVAAAAGAGIAMGSKGKSSSSSSTSSSGVSVGTPTVSVGQP